MKTLGELLSQLSCQFSRSNSNSNSNDNSNSNNNNNNNNNDITMDDKYNYSITRKTLLSYLNPFCVSDVMCSKSRMKPPPNLLIHSDAYIMLIMLSFFRRHVFTNYDIKNRTIENYNFSKMNRIDVIWLFDCFVRRASKAGCKSGIGCFTGHGCKRVILCADSIWTFCDIRQSGLKFQFIFDMCSLDQMIIYHQ